MTQEEFYSLYKDAPPTTHAELIKGVVLMASPVGLPHGRAQSPLWRWLAHYADQTPGIEDLENTSVVLDDWTEVQPDLLLRVLTSHGGKSDDTAGRVEGPPELVLEISSSSRYVDLGPKYDEYERAGVDEYLVLSLDPAEVLWFALREGRYERIHAGGDGLLKSRVFPGLWLDPAALLAGDTRRLREVVDLGVATSEHAAFVARLEAARGDQGGQPR
jgi:Uma2 family endonuclease